MATAGATTSPIGHHMFCLEQPSECVADPAGRAEPLRITQGVLQVVSSVNLAINKAIKPASDRDLYGVEERWTYPGASGDCEDYALLKRRSLQALGVATSDLLMTVVRKRNGEGHAVLTLRTTQGDYVLDNLSQQMKLWQDTPYTFVKRQNAANPQRWVSIDAGADVVVGSLKK